METIKNISLGFGVALTPINLILCLTGCFIGTLIGVLPGIGPAGTVALLIPVTFTLPPATAIIMLSGIFYGAMYGGSTTAILVNIPGEAASAVTCIDGYQMARQGRAGPALGIAAFGSLIAGTIGVCLLILIAPPLAEFSLKLGPPEMFSIMVFALTILGYLSSGSLIKAFIIALMGLIIGTIGTDISGVFRFTFGIPDFYDGIGLVPVIMGLFGVSEVLLNIEQRFIRQVFQTKIKGLLPNKEDWKSSIKPITRGTLIGFFVGVLPGPSNTISSFISYAIEKRFSKYPERFGTGVIEGVAGPESANNSATSGAFIPLFVLGIPSNAVMALLLGALMIHGLQPGPLLIKENPEVFWGTIVSMYIGNVMLLILNLPLIGLWVKVLKVPYRILFPLILFFCVIGCYSLDNRAFDVFMMLIFGIIGYIFRKVKYEPAPLVLAFILGPLMENALGQSLLMFGGDFSLFITRPISGSCLIIALFLLLSSIFLGKRRRAIAKLS